MARKILGQSYPAAGLLVDLYTVPAEKSATGSSVVICNQGAWSGCFRVSAAKAGAADERKQYLYRDVTLAPYDSFVATIGPTLAETDVLRVYSASGLLSFTLFGDES